MFRSVLGALAIVLAWTGCAVAQERDTSSQTRPPITIEFFTRGAAIWSAAMSPDGRSIAAIQESALGDVLKLFTAALSPLRASPI